MTKLLLSILMATSLCLFVDKPVDAGDVKLKFGFHWGTPVYPTPIYPPPPGFVYVPDYPYYLYGPPPRPYYRYYGPSFGFRYEHGRHRR